MAKTRSRKRIVRRKSVRGGDDSLEERYAAAVAKREKADRELATTLRVASEKKELDLEGIDPALPALRKLRELQEAAAAAKAKSERADRELAATKSVAAAPGTPTATEALAAAKKKREDAEAAAAAAVEAAAKARAAKTAADAVVAEQKRKAAVPTAAAVVAEQKRKAAEDDDDGDDEDLPPINWADRFPMNKAKAKAEATLTEAEIFERDRKLTRETALRALPSGWKRRGPDEENDIWYEAPDGTTQFSNPNYTPKLPDGWIERQDAEGDVWFVNQNTSTSQYQRPKEGGKRRRVRGGGGEKPETSHPKVGKPVLLGGGRHHTRGRRAPRKSTRGRRR
jgi:hypothetical protein